MVVVDLPTGRVLGDPYYLDDPSQLYDLIALPNRQDRDQMCCPNVSE